MKTLLKLIAVAAAFGLAPAAALAQNAAAPAGQAQMQPSPPPSDAISARSQASPALPQEASDPSVANIAGEEPSDAQVAQSTMASRTTPTPGIGQPDGRMGLQDQVTPIGHEAAWFHNAILLPAITAISVLVLVLMLYVVIRYRRRAHPVPSRTTHNTVLEVVWTLVPVLILVAIAVPSIRLLANQYSPPRADLTIKAIGNQWYWTYQYPDNGGFELVSNMLSEEDAAARGEPRLLAVDERVVVPVGATVKVIVTSNDVIHAWGVPAFWVKIDAVPGRLNETWFRAERPGLYYGQCFELCGARHAYMPIAVEVVSPAQFAAWVASKGGTMPGAAPQRSVVPDDTMSTTEDETILNPPAEVDAVTRPPVSEQSAPQPRVAQ